MRAAVLLLILAAPAPAGAAERRVGLGSFDRLRVTGPFEVAVLPGSPSATVSGDPAAVERTEVRVDGTVLTVRTTGGWEERARTGGGPVTVTLRTPRLSAAAVFAGTRLAVRRMAGERVELSISGAGSVAVDEAVADQLVATVIGAGQLKVAGRARRVRLLTNGPGGTDASGLAADELSVRLEGPGETLAAARYSAEVVNTGVGRVAVTGTAKCRVSAPGGGPVTCGAARQDPIR